MGLGLTIKAEYITRDSLVTQLIGDVLGLEVKSAITTAFYALTGRRRMEVLRKATKPTKVRFFNPSPVTDICTSLNGKVWDIDSPNVQYPPLHWGCKSVLTYE